MLRPSTAPAFVALAFGAALAGCSSTPLRAVQIRSAVSSAIWQTQAIATQALLWPLALDVDRDGTREELAQRSQVRLADRLACATTTLDDTVLAVDFGDGVTTTCTFDGRLLAGRATIEWVDFDAGADRRALVRFDGVRTTADITLVGEAYYEVLGERTISIDAELDVADPDITSAAVGVIVAIFDEDLDTRAELNGLWTWQATAVGGAYVDLRRAVMDLGSTAPVDGFFEINGNADKSVMVQFLADADGTLRAWANAGARDREYVIDASANVVEE